MPTPIKVPGTVRAAAPAQAQYSPAHNSAAGYPSYRHRPRSCTVSITTDDRRQRLNAVESWIWKAGKSSQTMSEPVFQIEEVNDPIEVARCKAQDERARRNSDWLQSHWADLLPQARGKFVAVAGQEAFIAATPEEAWAMARAAHPEDDGALSQYVFPGQGPRIYENRWRMASV